MVKPDRSRYVYLYLPSSEDKARWESLARKAGVPLSRFVIEVFESAIAEGSEYKPRKELMLELGRLRAENRELRDDLRQKKIVIERYEKELRRYRSEAFLDTGFEGVRRYNREIIRILRRGGTVESYRLLEELNIDPGDSDLVKAVSSQLEDLEAYGLVARTAHGWRWIG
ncbi:MAG: hypothetical protein N3G75_02550 [Methanothrix sp.]|nr:hypothetical protein [Methanothrix sp.]MCX8206696.1 hypothetical protein [Methanothrix sp.]